MIAGCGDQGICFSETENKGRTYSSLEHGLKWT